MTHELWFKRQYGPRPTTIRPVPLQQKIRELREEIKRLDELRIAAEVWDANYHGTRLAWNRGEGAES